MIKNLFYNRSFIWNLVKQELKGRYTASVIGFSWTIINPILTILVFVVVFSEMMQLGIRGVAGSNTENYVLYIAIGIVSWNSFSEAVIRSTDIFVEYSVLIKRVLFPKEILIAQVMLATTINLIIGIFLLMILMIILQYPLQVRMIFIIIPLLIQSALTFGLALLFSTLNVFFRDTSSIVKILLHIWFWITPIVYSTNIIPEQYESLTQLNPMTHLMGIYRSFIFNIPLPEVKGLIIISTTSLALLFLGCYLFKKMEKDFSDEV